MDSDGTVAEFRKDGTAVGSIGSINGDLSIGTGDAALRFNDSSNRIEPFNVTTNANTNGTVDLGVAGASFKDLYLSGSAFIDTQLRAGNGSAASPSMSFSGDSDSGLFRATTNVLGFSTTGTERMRIDASGNSIFGSTVTDRTTADGTTIASVGFVDVSRTSAIAGRFTRRSTDGEILNFRKDGTTVGSIGADAGFLHVGQGNSNLLFIDSGQPRVIPRKIIGTSSNGFADLGDSGSRFKDLYLSGGVYLGGTGAANKLDDYEEGSFTPVIADAASGGNVASGYGNQYGYYTKVGRLVTCVFDLTNIATVGMTNANDIYIRDLPFTASGHSGAPQFTAPVIGGGSMTSALSLYAAIQDNFSSVRLINSNQTSASAFLNVSNISSGATDLRFSITYFAA
jgi:hypothetical protein